METFFSDADYREYLYLMAESSDEEYETLKRYERTGRPLGSEAFVDQLEKLTSRILKKQKPGPKKSN